MLARAWALSAGSRLRAEGIQHHAQTGRQRGRQWYYAPRRQRGPTRHARRGETCCTPLLRGGGGWWQGPPLALAIDATPWGRRCVVVAVSGGSRGCAIPVAWGRLPAGAKHAWRREWGRLRRLLRPALPAGGPVSVLAARGV